MWLSAEFVNNLITVLNALASQISAALDTLNYALTVNRSAESDASLALRQPRNSRHGLRPRIITERITSDRSRSPPRRRTRPLDTSSTWYVPELSPPRQDRHATPGTGAEHETRPGGTPRTALVANLPPPRVTAPTTINPLLTNVNRGPVTTPTSAPHSDSEHSIRPHPGASSFRPSPTVVHGPRELLQEFTAALRNAYNEPVTALTQGELDEMVRRKKTRTRGPPTKPLPVPSRRKAEIRQLRAHSDRSRENHVEC